MGGSVETDNGHLFKVRNFETGVMHRRTTSVAEHGCLRKDYYQRRTTKVVHDVNTSLSHRSYLGRFQAQPPILTPPPPFFSLHCPFSDSIVPPPLIFSPPFFSPPTFFYIAPTTCFNHPFYSPFQPIWQHFLYMWPACSCRSHTSITTRSLNFRSL